nr:type II toxin-antitoxin system HicA family toxin [Prosthecomicrobium pneumaticum]
MIRRLEKAGWVLERVSGDHHTFKHPEREKLITIPHPRKDLSIGIVRSTYRAAGWDT